MGANRRAMIFLLMIATIMLIPDRAKAKVVTISIGERLSWYLNDDDTLKRDDELALEAQYLADQWRAMKRLTQVEGAAFDRDKYLGGEAMALMKADVARVRGKDVYGMRISPDGRGYKTGREYKDAMITLWKDPDKFFANDELDDFLKLDRERKLENAKANLSSTRMAEHFVASICNSDPEFEPQWENRVIYEREMILRTRYVCEGSFVSDMFVDIYNSIHSLTKMVFEHAERWVVLMRRAFGREKTDVDVCHGRTKCPWMKAPQPRGDGADMVLERECLDYGLFGESIICAVKLALYLCPILFIGICIGLDEGKESSPNVEIESKEEKGGDLCS